MPSSKMPDYQAQLATLVKRPPEGDRWLHEIKYDGYRIGCRIEGKALELWSRRGNDWTSKFPEVRDAARGLEVKNALIDGEVAVLLSDGRTSFHALQTAFKGARPKRLVYFVFDLLWLDDEDLRRLPLEERKARLRELVSRRGDEGTIRYSDHVVGHGPETLEHACKLKLEGIVSKRRSAPYTPTRNMDWLKSKCVQRQELVIGGFTDPEGSRVGLGSLLCGYYEGDALRFAGKVGTGFTHRYALQLRKRLETLEIRDCPFTPPPEGWLGRNAHWVVPELVAEVEFTEWTPDGKVRHPSFQGLREDKNPKEIVRELPSSDPPREEPRATKSNRAEPRTTTRKLAARRQREPDDAPTALGVKISNPWRVMYPKTGMTKLDVARYYEALSDWMLPHTEDRPLTLVRCATGVGAGCTFMKHSKVWAPEPLRRVRIREKTKLGEYLIADSPAALVALAQMDVLEVHTWNTKYAHVEQPDRIVFDFDPGPEVPWRETVEAARLMRKMLDLLELASFVKTTGGVGLHVVVPIVPERDWTECLKFSRDLAEALAREHPRRYTTAFAKQGREGKILIDYLRNNRTNTSISAYSLRAKELPTVSVPIAWDELSPRLRPDRFTAETVLARVARQKLDPWAEYFRSRQRLTQEVLRAVGSL